MSCVKSMTNQVFITESEKVQGIRGLYKDQSSGRFYVRYSFHGIDKQLTICPKNSTFSGLDAAARKGLNELKKIVKSIANDKESDAIVTKKDKISCAQTALVKAVETHWARRGTTQKHIYRLLQFTRGMCLCRPSNRKDASTLDAHNLEIARSVIEGASLSDCQKREAYRSIYTVFNELIHAGIHTGNNPAHFVIRPKHNASIRESELTFEDAAIVIHAIREDKTVDAIKRAEAELFLRLCMETGQRPIDIHMWTPMKMTPDRHYQFSSHKTSRAHRVKHIISKQVQELAMTIVLMRSGSIEYPHKFDNKFGNDEHYSSFWRLTKTVYENYINAIIRHELCDESKTLYCARHFFVSEIFRRTESEFWSEVFTHEGKTINQRNYLHPDQEKADEIIIGYMNAFEQTLNS